MVISKFARNYKKAIYSFKYKVFLRLYEYIKNNANIFLTVPYEFHLDEKTWKKINWCGDKISYWWKVIHKWLLCEKYMDVWRCWKLRWLGQNKRISNKHLVNIVYDEEVDGTKLKRCLRFSWPNKIESRRRREMLGV